MSLRRYPDKWNNNLSAIVTNPPPGTHPVENLYFDPATGDIEYQYDDATSTPKGVSSNPPAGMHRVIALWHDPVLGLQMTIDNTPV